MNRVFAIAFVILLARCASQTSPQGGPKDEDPPTLTSSKPENNQVAYSGKSIELTFSEPIKLNNPKEQIIIIPPIGKKTEYTAKKTKLEITPELPWKENTTYTINFQEAVQDITEGNPVEGLRLAFSTGEYIDSLRIEGAIKDAYKETIPENITVAIYQADTFNIFEHTPSYFTKASKEGKFSITNLQPGNYRLYAFQDKNKNLKVESRTESYGFLADTIRLIKNISNISVPLVQLDSRPLRITSKRVQSDVNLVRFNKFATKYHVTTQQPVRHTFGSDQSEILIYYPGNNPDSLAITLTAFDSLAQRVDTTLYIKRDNNERIKEPYRASFSEPIFNAETGLFSTAYTTNKLIETINSDSIYLRIDTTKTITFNRQDLALDTLGKMITITKAIELDEDYKKLFLKTGKAFVTTIDGDSTKPETKPIKIIDNETTATLTVQVKTPHPHYIVEVLSNNYTVLASKRNDPNPTFRFLSPENIKVRLIIDDNNNGIWDTANILLNKEPEKIFYYQTEEGKYDTPLRANWEVGPLLITSEQRAKRVDKTAPKK
jgi:hypothetical protein